MSHALHIHDGLGSIAEDPSLGILLAYGSTVPAAASVGYAPGCKFIKTNGTTLANVMHVNVGTKASSTFVTAGPLSTSASLGIGYATGAGGAVTQITSRTTGVILNTVTGAITLVSAAGSAAAATFTVTNSTVAATDVVLVSQKSGTDLYEIFVTNVAAGSFKITSLTTGGTTTEQPVFSFAVIKGVAA